MRGGTVPWAGLGSPCRGWAVVAGTMSGPWTAVMFSWDASGMVARGDWGVSQDPELSAASSTRRGVVSVASDVSSIGGFSMVLESKQEANKDIQLGSEGFQSCLF